MCSLGTAAVLVLSFVGAVVPDIAPASDQPELPPQTTAEGPAQGVSLYNVLRQRIKDKPELKAVLESHKPVKDSSLDAVGVTADRGIRKGHPIADSEEEPIPLGLSAVLVSRIERINLAEDSDHKSSNTTDAPLPTSLAYSLLNFQKREQDSGDVQLPTTDGTNESLDVTLINNELDNEVELLQEDNLDVSYSKFSGSLVATPTTIPTSAERQSTYIFPAPPSTTSTPSTTAAAREHVIEPPADSREIRPVVTAVGDVEYNLVSHGPHQDSPFVYKVVNPAVHAFRGSSRYRGPKLAALRAPKTGVAGSSVGAAQPAVPAPAAGPLFSCHGKPAGFYPDPRTGCQMYHQCTHDGRKFQYRCGIGTAFNQRTKVCDHQNDVICNHL